MYESCLAKQQHIKELFDSCVDREARYQKIIDLGKALSSLDGTYKVEDNLVKGCQSQMYIRAYSQDGLIVFEGESDALISQGLAALLIMVYSHEIPEVILKCPPSYLDELEIAASLTPSRANGLYSVHLRMKQDALKLLISK